MKHAARQLTLVLVLLTAPAAARALPPGIMPVTGRTAPALKLNDFNGEPYNLADTSGHWRFVHFWASWCAPCRREMPSIQKAMHKLAGTGIEFVLVNTAESEDDVFTFLAQVAPELTPLMDTDGLVTAAWQPRGLPATFLVDPQGVIRFQALGGRHWNEPVYLDFLRSLPGPGPTPATPAGSR